MEKVTYMRLIKIVLYTNEIILKKGQNIPVYSTHSNTDFINTQTQLQTNAERDEHGFP